MSRASRSAMAGPGLGIRWTVGDVSEFGFEALRASVWGAHRLFGARAAYVVCVNSVRLERARQLTGNLPLGVKWRDVSHEFPAWLRPHFDARLAEGVAWKFAPLRIFNDLPELSLDNDCILWAVPDAMQRWLADPASCLIAEDVRRCFGQFESVCGDRPLNSGIRGIGARFDWQAALHSTLEACTARLSSELDEQGLQVAVARRAPRLHVVSVDQVTICSPFPPHLPHLGSAGAHFVGLNARSLGWSLAGKPAEEYTREHWLRHRKDVLERTGAPPRPAPPGASRPARPAPSLTPRQGPPGR